MKLVFVSNFYNHHQKALSSAFHRLTGGAYHFISTEEIPEEQRNLGYGCEDIPDYVLYAHRDEEERKLCQCIINEADVVIAGSAPEYLLRERIKAGKLVFRYAERPLKKGFEPLKYLPRLWKWHRRNPMGNPIYMLCASAYTAQDYGKFGLFRGRCYKWGYFPEAKEYDVEKLFAGKQNRVPKILWCGRFLEWKHPDDAVRIAQRLKRGGYQFELNLIGTGPLEQQLGQMIREKRLEDCVHMLGAMPPELVRKHMELANVYLFTSDRNEGWGAVLNESMNSGCAVVASHAIGAVPFLMKNGENGLIYEYGNVDMLYEKVKYLLDCPEEQVRLGGAAYRTITTQWDANRAAERFVGLAQRILEGENQPNLFVDGPCSRAEVQKDGYEQNAI